MYQVIIVIHVLLGLGVIGLVLMQQGKGADAGAAFGTGSAGSVFGAQGAASFLSRSTAVLATLFFSTSLGLAVVNGHRDTERDLMTSPAPVEQNNSGLPSVEGAKTPEIKAPIAVPDTKETPTPQSSSQPVDDSTPTKVIEEVKSTEVVKPAESAEQTKPIAEKKPVEAAEKKPVVTEHKAVAKDDKKAATHKGKDAKKDH
ncbi:MAG: preprotein translocase subunit SecG [Methylococcales bacterium]